MNRIKDEDWKGLGVSVAVHALLFLLFGLATATTEHRLPGMVEVEFGRFETAQAPARSETPATVAAQTQPRPQPQAALRQPQAAPSPRLPQTRPTPEPERVPPPSPDRDQPRPEGRQQPAAPAAQPAPRDEAGGRPEAITGTTSAAIADGEATARRAPFDIDGLQDRNVVFFPLPSNPGARGTSVTAVCIGADGSVTSAFPAMRTGTPELDAAARQAILRWRFTPLPPAAPQTEQCGRITFRFTLS